MATRRLINYLSSKEIRDWLMSTHFWGPFATWSIPIAAIADTQKDVNLISGKMTFGRDFLFSSFVDVLFNFHEIRMESEST
ncbi:hypothetical protein OUZ56_031100 [Daphnia magna]|uniref:Mitochondrial pyruvate carrier n=1 Tax=Daphnia magna TaxID=35525 RepID=A0ABQ9ZT88_9CRUS|nr:hypothetical protein OUZ56_031100 [Daphnia magna]